MRVSDVMTIRVEACTPETDLGTVAMVLWWSDCGVAPVVEGPGRRVVGMITDRDICMAVATRHCGPEEIRVGEVISRDVAKVTADDPVDVALETMETRQVRRLPVVGAEGELVGLLSLNDLILKAETGPNRARPALGAKDLLRVLKAVSRHRKQPALEEAAASR